ncbi:MAG: hypothetical protein RR089_07780 [Acidaminococcaceae bacterium]
MYNRATLKAGMFKTYEEFQRWYEQEEADRYMAESYEEQRLSTVCQNNEEIERGLIQFRLDNGGICNPVGDYEKACAGDIRSKSLRNLMESSVLTICQDITLDNNRVLIVADENRQTIYDITNAISEEMEAKGYSIRDLSPDALGRTLWGMAGCVDICRVITIGQ